ncbi:hypothetical protein GWK47_025978 [Chionoecetes opilio]|uniref:Uncharacterized protein n=1 Tax=Chionoecetes opilio TaxID=41210 RepID=A0A8J8WF04_CHIOP|nr:hypothetical protein GWK47_025978 [Chionoecetes opilio]
MYLALSFARWVIDAGVYASIRRLGTMEPPPTPGPRRPAIQIKKEVKEEPEYIYVDETLKVLHFHFGTLRLRGVHRRLLCRFNPLDMWLISQNYWQSGMTHTPHPFLCDLVCRVKLEESDEEVILCYRCATDVTPMRRRCSTDVQPLTGAIAELYRCAAVVLPMCYRCDTEVSPKRRRGLGHVTNLYKYGPLLENLTMFALDAELTTAMPSEKKGPAIKAPPKKKAKPAPKSRKGRGRGKKTSPTPQAPAPLADTAADEPAPRSPTPPHDSFREPSPESRSSRSSSVDSQASAGSNTSVTSTAASTSTVASVSSKAKGKAVTKKNTSSLTLPEENQMVDWLEDPVEHTHDGLQVPGQEEEAVGGPGCPHGKVVQYHFHMVHLCP